MGLVNTLARSNISNINISQSPGNTALKCQSCAKPSEEVVEGNPGKDDSFNSANLSKFDMERNIITH